MSKPPIVWTIAGFDPSCGAGIGTDLKTISTLDCYGAACITALTVQNTLGVRRIEPVSAATVREMLQALVEDLPPNAIKIGMLATEEIASAVVEFLATPPSLRCPVVLDPILRSSSGAELLDAAGLQVLLTRLLPLATVVTPNREEAAALTGLPIGNAEGAAKALRRLGAVAAVVTGGDPLRPGYFSSEDAGSSFIAEGLPGSEASHSSEDVLAYGQAGQEFVKTLTARRIHSTSTHGTGCAFSTAIACELARGESIPVAVTSAKAFVRRAIERAPGLGLGRGPLGL
jgi:hydroxymethylpyrimidine/phosphomethylpyrimidine kinase